MHEFSRTEKLIGLNAMNRLNDSTVMVIGLGGVGSYALEALARSGVGHIIVVDHDTVDITNINRQLVALHSTISIKKVVVAEERLKDINPKIQVTRIEKPFTVENTDEILSLKPDYICDCFDSISDKIHLIIESHKRGLNLISVMGTGNKFDPTKFVVTDISKTYNDPVARIVRKKIKESRVRIKLPVVFSDELPIKLYDSSVASNAYVPATAGLIAASYVVNEIIKGD
jgi:tRNA A37 threonylcarbamoyladenosine dehydratase